jgi:chorismate lyase / 3-hydroxybenzoate synthase
MGSPQTRSRFRFGFGRLADAAAGLPVPVLGGAEEETLFTGAEAIGTEDGFSLFDDGGWLLGFWVGDAAPDLGAQTKEIYSNMLGLTRARGRSLARIWNYVPEINEDSLEGLENYRVFCRGRAQAFESEPDGAVPPAASAVGGTAGRLAVLFAAAPNAPRRLENPEQVPAYEYPPEHGPRSPSFSRASQVEVNGRRYTFVSGTAAIKGHVTIAPDSLAGQIDCTLDNLRLISGVCGLGEDLGAGRARERHFKVYLRNVADLAAARAELDARLLRADDRVCWLHSDICRAALKLEIEATVVD